MHGLHVQLGKAMNAIKQGCDGQLLLAGHQRLVCPSTSAHGTSLNSTPSQGCTMHAAMRLTCSTHPAMLNMAVLALMYRTHTSSPPLLQPTHSTTQG